MAKNLKKEAEEKLNKVEDKVEGITESVKDKVDGIGRPQG